MRLALIRIGFVASFLALTGLSGFAQSGIISTYAGPALPVNGALATTQAIDYPVSVAPDGAGGFYVASQHQNRIYRVAADGALSHVAGSGLVGYGGDGGPATAAKLDSPFGVAVDTAGNLYIADADNHRIRKVTTGGVISTVAGNGTGSSGDGGPATSAQLNLPSGRRGRYCRQSLYRGSIQSLHSQGDRRRHDQHRCGERHWRVTAAMADRHIGAIIVPLWRRGRYGRQSLHRGYWQ